MRLVVGVVSGVGDLSHEGPDFVKIRVLPLVLVAGSRGVRDGDHSASIIRFVFLQMTVQVRLLPETPLAERALKWLLLVMNVPDVPLQVRGNAEGPLAVFALVRLLARVRPEMARQVGRPREDLPAELTRVTILHLRGDLVGIHDILERLDVAESRYSRTQHVKRLVPLLAERSEEVKSSRMAEGRGRRQQSLVVRWRSWEAVEARWTTHRLEQHGRVDGSRIGHRRGDVQLVIDGLRGFLGLADVIHLERFELLLNDGRW